MDFNLDQERQQLRDLLERFVRRDYGFEARRKIAASPGGFSREVWGEFAKLGLLGIGLPEDHGGMGGNGVDVAIVAEALGTGLVLEPFVSTVVLCGGLIREAGSAAQKERLLAAIAGGGMLVALAHDESGGRYELSRVTTTAKAQANGYVINGAKRLVLHGDSADQLIVAARTSGGASDTSGISLFLVDAKAKGVARKGYATRDSQRAADIEFRDVEVAKDALVGGEGQGYAALERAVDGAIAALCAEAVGCMDALNAQTLEYLKTRKQFGVAIGTFQVLKHRMTDMFIHAAQARSMALLAAMRVDHPDAAERRSTISAAKTLVGRSGRFVGQQAIQLHGGMGVTDELAVSHHFRRLTAINATFGDAEHHLARYSDAMKA